MAQQPARRRGVSPPGAPAPPDLEQQPPSSNGAAGSASSSADSQAVSELERDVERDVETVEWVADPGPEFDAEQAASDHAAAAEERAFSLAPGDGTVDIQWHEPVVRSMLESQGSALHSLAGKAERDWIYTRTELAAIAPPLTRILNRYPSTRVAAAGGDELALILGLSGYTARSIGERRRALAAEEALDSQGSAKDQPLVGHPLGPLGVPVQPLIPDPSEVRR